MRDADVVACEDTRRTRKLLSHFGIRAKDLVVYHEGNERRQASGLFERIVAGETVVLVSDAGMPGLSDPGYRLVKLCADAGVTVEVVPGPSAAIAALAISGLPPGRFTFEGFFPRKKGDRRRRIEDLVTDARTMIVYESPHRIEETLEDLVDLLGERPAALARELTKMHEEVRRGTLGELLAGVRKEPPRGEIVLLIGGAVHEHKPVPAPAELAQMVRAMMEDGTDRKEAMHTVAREAGVPKRVVFDALVEERS